MIMRVTESDKPPTPGPAAGRGVQRFLGNLALESPAKSTVRVTKLPATVTAATTANRRPTRRTVGAQPGRNFGGSEAPAAPGLVNQYRTAEAACSPDSETGSRALELGPGPLGQVSPEAVRLGPPAAAAGGYRRVPGM
eukprot:730796-Hanusia_phi.AAC.1